MKFRQPNAILGSLLLFALFLLVYVTIDRFDVSEEQEIHLEEKHLELKLKNLADELNVIKKMK